jgi:hypothetical protein
LGLSIPDPLVSVRIRILESTGENIRGKTDLSSIVTFKYRTVIFCLNVNVPPVGIGKKNYENNLFFGTLKAIREKNLTRSRIPALRIHESETGTFTDPFKTLWIL